MFSGGVVIVTTGCVLYIQYTCVYMQYTYVAVAMQSLLCKYFTVQNVTESEKKPIIQLYVRTYIINN